MAAPLDDASDTVMGYMKIFYTNADSISNKTNELMTIVDTDRPDVICITETLPKYCSYLYQNHCIQGYEAFHGNRGRGVSIYVKECYATEVIPLHNNFIEKVFVKITMKSHKKLIIGCIYRSPNSNNGNNDALLTLLEEASGLDSNHLILVGDFNYKEVNWKQNYVQAGETHPAYKIFDKLNDLFLEQLISEPTRFRRGEQENTLDWLLTDSKEIIDNVNLGPPLGENGDHCTIKFEVKLTRENICIKDSLNFFKGDYDKLKKIVRRNDWEILLRNKCVEEAWSIFYGKLSAGIQECIPKKMARKKKSQLWINAEVKL